MPSPTSDRHRTTHAAALTITRSYQPDPARCVAALVALLSYQPDNMKAASPAASKDTP
jgi:hypothetical protein